MSWVWPAFDVIRSSVGCPPRSGEKGQICWDDPFCSAASAGAAFATPGPRIDRDELILCVLLLASCCFTVCGSWNHFDNFYHCLEFGTIQCLALGTNLKIFTLWKTNTYTLPSTQWISPEPPVKFFRAGISF